MSNDMTTAFSVIDGKAAYGRVIDHTENYAVLLNDAGNDNNIVFLPVCHPKMLAIGTSEATDKFLPVCTLEEYVELKNQYISRHGRSDKRSAPAEVSAYGMRADAKSRADKMKRQLHDELDQLIEDWKEPEKMLPLLNLFARCEEIKPLRTMALIAAQKPDATDTATVTEWQRRGGRVRDNATPIRILLTSFNNGHETDSDDEDSVGTLFDISDVDFGDSSESPMKETCDVPAGDINYNAVLGELLVSIAMIPNDVGRKQASRFTQWTSPGCDNVGEFTVMQALKFIGAHCEKVSIAEVLHDDLLVD